MKVGREREKSIERTEAGPARSDPDAMPIGEAIEDCDRRGDLSLGIPALGSGIRPWPHFRVVAR